MTSAHRTILVTCVGGMFIYDIISALRSASDFSARILGCDANPQAAGRILVDRFAILPFAEKDPKKYISDIFQLLKEERVNVILPLSESESRLLSLYRDDLRRLGVSLSVSGPKAVGVITDKLTLLEQLREKGVYVPDFHPVDTLRDIDSALSALGYPTKSVVIKPRRSAGARGVLIFDSDASASNSTFKNRGSIRASREIILNELDANASSFQRHIAVPYVDGPVFDVDCIVIEGEATDIVPRRRQWRDPLSPASTGNRIEMNASVIDYCRELCRALCIDGAADFDVALEADGRPVIFDAGTRLSGSVGGAVLAGANIPAQLIRVLTGLPRQEFSVRDGVVVRPFMTFVEIKPEKQNDLI